MQTPQVDIYVFTVREGRENFTTVFSTHDDEILTASRIQNDRHNIDGDSPTASFGTQTMLFLNNDDNVRSTTASLEHNNILPVYSNNDQLTTSLPTVHCL